MLLCFVGNGLVRKKVIEAGQGEKSRPERGQEVTIEIASFTEDDSSLDPKKKISFIIADFDVAEVCDSEKVHLGILRHFERHT